MQEHVATPGSADAGEPWLDAERLDVYRIALEFQALASTLALGRGLRELRDQLDRASISIVLNTAEGAGRRTPADRARAARREPGRAYRARRAQLCALFWPVGPATSPWLMRVMRDRWSRKRARGASGRDPFAPDPGARYR